MPGMWVTIGIFRYFNAGPAFRDTLVSVAAPGETAYTAIPEGSRRASAAVHQAMMSFASAQGKFSGPIEAQRHPHLHDRASQEAAWQAVVKVSGVDLYSAAAPLNAVS